MAIWGFECHQYDNNNDVAITLWTEQEVAGNMAVRVTIDVFNYSKSNLVMVSEAVESTSTSVDNRPVMLPLCPQ